MINQGWGRIVNISSVMAFMAYGQDVGYCTAKSGILGLTRSLAVELGKHGINVNAICPGHIRTPIAGGYRQACGATGRNVSRTVL